MVPLPTIFYIFRWKLLPTQGPTGACGWAPSFSLRPSILLDRPQSSLPHPQSFSPMAPLMSNSPFWTLTQTTWTCTASGSLKLSKIIHQVKNKANSNNSKRVGWVVVVSAWFCCGNTHYVIHVLSLTNQVWDK